MVHSLSQAQAGILWMLLSAACLAGGNTLVRTVADGVHPFQISFLSNLIVFAFVWPYLLRPGSVPPERRTERRRLYAIMTVAGGISNMTWFYALANVPLAKATAITFAAPIIVTALAGIVLGERVSRAKWIAVMTGFAGVLIIARPGLVTLDSGTAALLISTMTMALMFMLSKRLTGIEPTERILVFTTIIPIVTGFLPAVLTWRTPGMYTIAFLFIMTLAMLAGRWTLLLALRHAPASTVMPFDFARLPFITVFAFLLYRESPDQWAILGAIIIAGAGLYIMREEQELRRHRLA